MQLVLKCNNNILVEDLNNIFIALIEVGTKVLHIEQTKTLFSVNSVQQLVKQIPRLQFITVDIDLVDKAEWATLLNNMCGKVNFFHNLIDQIPLKYLRFPREAYSVCSPSGFQW